MKKVLVLFLFLLLIILFFMKRPQHNFPNIIWSYWDDPHTIPNTVKLCIESWRQHNPSYTIVLMNRTSYSEYVSIPDTINPNFNDFPARFADLVRICCLAKHGGVWVDSSVIMSQSLDSWLQPCELQGFTIGEPKPTPVLENWFFACVKGSSFMKLWRDEFLQLAKYDTNQHYLDSRKDMGVDFSHVQNPSYLTMHVAAQKVFQKDKYPLSQLLLQRSEDGPFKYLVDSNWDSEKGLELACKNKSYRKPFLKLRGTDRKVFERNSSFSNDVCGWI
jgi:hypothetical protein